LKKVNLRVLGLIFGLVLLASLCYRIGTIDLRSLLRPQLLLLVAVTPLWTGMAVLAMRCLVPGKVSLLHLYRLELSSDAMGRLIPSGGLAGEPWRAIQLAPRLGGAVTAARVVLSYRCMHTISGLIQLGWTTGLSLWLEPWTGYPRQALQIAAWVGWLGALGMVLGCFCFPPVRDRLSPRRRMLAALFFKTAERVLQLTEILILFLLLGIVPTIARVVSVGALISISTVVFVMVPGNVGVSELSILKAFTQLGLDPASGLTMGLLREGRLLVWTLVGAGLLAIYPGLKPDSEAGPPNLSE
jgi:hypothetical protein